MKAVFVWSCHCILSVKCLSDYLWIVENRFGLQQQVNFGTGHGARTVHNQLFKLQGALSIQQRRQVIYLKRRLAFVTCPTTLLHSRISGIIFSFIIINMPDLYLRVRTAELAACKCYRQLITFL